MTTLDLIEYSRPLGAPSHTEQGVIANWDAWEAVLAEAWEERPQSQRTDEDIDEAQDGVEGDDESAQRYLQLVNSRLKSGRYVGTICRDDVTINIWPRVFRGYLEADGLALDGVMQRRGVMTRNMLHWASTAEYFNLNPSRGDASPPEDISSFFDAYLWMFSDFTRDLLARQPYWQYQSEIEEGEVLRGRLVMNQYITDCLARGRWHRLVHEHEPFVFDNLLNRIIKRTCRLAQGLCGSDQVNEKLAEILFELDEVGDMCCTAPDCDRVYLNRLHAEYQMVLDNCRMILATCQADNAGRDMKRFCFLLPMDRLFEEYLRTLAGEAVGQAWHLENFRPYLIREPEAFQIRNDYYFVNSENGKTMIADAKWKDRNDKHGRPKSNYGVRQADMYQMVAYAYRRSCREVHLLYPAMSQNAKCEEIVTLKAWPEGEMSANSINVHIHELKIHWDDTRDGCFQKVKDDCEKSVISHFSERILNNSGV